MAFGWSVSDIVLLSNLAWKTLKNTRNACGEHDELTSELSTFHTVLRRLEQEVSKPESPLNRPGDTSKEDVERIFSECQKPLSLLNKVVAKYNSLSKEERSLKKLWLQVKFGNGEVANTRDIRDRILSHTSALTFYLNLVSTGAIGRVEKQMEDAGSDLKELKKAVNNLTARLAIEPHSEGSILTTRTNDDKAVWKDFRRSLLKEGFNSSLLEKHKSLIEAYLKELGDRGVLDDPQHPDEIPEPRLSFDVNSHLLQQSNQAAIGKATETELEQASQGRSLSPALEDINDSTESSSSVSVGNVKSSGQGPSPGGKASKRDSFDYNASLIPPGTDNSDHSSDGWTSADDHEWKLTLRKDATINVADHWNERRRTDTSAVESRYQHQQLHGLERSFIAKPWGICIIFHGIDISTLLADFEYMVLIQSASLATLIHRHRQRHDLRSRMYVLIQRTAAGAQIAKEIPRLIELLMEAGASKRENPLNNSLTFGLDDVGLSCTAFLATDFTDKSTRESLKGHGPLAIIRRIHCWVVDYVEVGFEIIQIM